MHPSPIRVAVLPNREKDPDLNVTGILYGLLQECQAEVVLEADIAQRMGQDYPYSPDADIFQYCDVAIAIGGDGTMLQVARGAASASVPVLGVNLGYMGFLPEVEIGEMREAVVALCRGEYRIEPRMMLMAQIDGREENNIYAVNDISITKGMVSRLIYIDAYVGGQPVGEFAADGVILSTPTGSTAYSLSAGGPVVCPEMDCILFTPICPHSLHMRPVVMSPNERVRLRVWDRESDIVLSIDGQHTIKLKGGDWVTLSQAPYPVQFIRIKPRNFFGVLHRKFLNG